jgi:hypothetical protein
MQSLTAISNRKNILLSATLSIIWLLLWFAPWQSLSVLSAWFKLSIALIVFTVPGLCIYGLIQDKPSGWLNHITFGFVISHLILAVFGTLGRLVHFPFALLKHGTMALGLILLLGYAIPKLASFKFSSIESTTIRNIASALPLVLMIIFAGLMTIQRVLSDDDLTYLALLNNWQKSSALNFNDVFFGADKLLSIRFWIVSTPFSQAFLAELSGLSGMLLLGGYYEPFLAALSLLSIHELAKTLGFSRFKAMVAVAFQVVFLSLLSEYLHPGAPFFRQLSVDKATATFIVIPIFLQSIVWYLSEPIKKNIILVTLTGLSLMLMHPIALVYGGMMAGMITVFGLNQTNIRARIGLLILLVLIMSPQIALRFVKSDAQAAIPYSVEDTVGIESLITVWGNTKFYGYNPAILAMQIPYADKLHLPTFLQYVWLIFPILGAMFALKQIRRDPLSQYVLACFLLGALAGIPFTGWILGSLVSAWMLERTLWLYPFGIGMMFTLTTLGDMTALTNQLIKWLQPLQTKTKIDSPHWLLATLTIFCSAVILLIMRVQNLPDFTRLALNTERYVEFTKIGELMDARTSSTQTFAVGTDRFNDYIPAIASKVKLISYRPSDPSYPYFYSPVERSQRFTDRQSIFSRDVSNEDRIALIRKYNIHFLWLKGGEYYMVKKMISTYPDIFTEHIFEGYYLIEVH